MGIPQGTTDTMAAPKTEERMAARTVVISPATEIPQTAERMRRTRMTVATRERTVAPCP